MTIILRTAICVAAIMCFVNTAPAIAKKARIVCEYGRCWQADAGYDYRYGYRPPTKWEQKVFCPPVGAKKSNYKERPANRRYGFRNSTWRYSPRSAEPHRA